MAKSKEQFYSNEKVVREMTTSLRNEIPICDLYIDPSAGHGELFRAFPRKSEKLGFDIDPPRNKFGSYPRGITKKCFIAAQLDIQRKIEEFQERNGYLPTVCVASNPPFRMLKRWFELISSYSDWVMWLAPAQYSRIAYQQEWVPPSYSLAWQKVLSDSVFVENGQEKLLPTVLQIWRKTNSIPLKLPTVELATRWRFENWNLFRHFDFKVCFCGKTGKLYPISSINLSKQYCCVKTEIRDEDGQSIEISQRMPLSVSSLIVLPNIQSKNKMLRLNKVISGFKNIPYCTRPSFSRYELKWIWMKEYETKKWVHLKSEFCKINKPLNSDIQLSDLDKYLFF